MGCLSDEDWDSQTIVPMVILWRWSFPMVATRPFRGTRMRRRTAEYAEQPRRTRRTDSLLTRKPLKDHNDDRQHRTNRTMKNLNVNVKCNIVKILYSIV